jgi:hypothetical protein
MPLPWFSVTGQKGGIVDNPNHPAQKATLFLPADDIGGIF